MSNISCDIKPTFWGRFLYYCVPFRRAIVLQNMRQVFQDTKSEQQIRTLAKAFYSHLATSLKENILMRFMSLKTIRSKAEVRGLEHIKDIMQNNQSMLLLTGHFGNWEFAPIAGILNFEAYRDHFYFIRKTIKTRWLEKLLFGRYYKAGLKIIPKDNAMNPVCDALEKKSAVVFVLDQHACIRAKDGIKAFFFGKEAGTYRSLAMLAQYTNTPVVPVQTYRNRQGKHVLQFHKPLEFLEEKSYKETLRVNTEQYNRQLEQMILAHPEQWMWMHRRWKL